MKRTIAANNGSAASGSADRLKWFDWGAFALIAVISYFCFLQPDIIHTGGVSFAYLNGHILDFYEYNAECGLTGCNYLPSTFILFALWNIPIRLLGLVTVPSVDVSTGIAMWYKLLPVLFYFASGYLIYLIAMTVKMGAVKARLCTYGFLAAPLAFFSQFIFSQYDVFTVFFILLGFYFWCRKELWKFALCFGFAITFKYFAFLFFVPLLMLREKNYSRIIGWLCLAAIPFGAETLFYLSSQAMRDEVFGFSVAGYFMNTSLSTGYSAIIIIPVIWLVLCAYAYLREYEDEVQIFKWAIYLCSLVVYISFGLSLWHPQWLIIAVPFLLFGMMIHKKASMFCIVDLLMMLFFTVYTVNFWADWVDQAMFANGVLGTLLNGRINSGLTMRGIFVISDTAILFTCFSAMLLISALFKHPKYLEDDFSARSEHILGWLRARFLVGVSIFLVPAFICLISAFHLPDPSMQYADARNTIGSTSKALAEPCFTVSDKRDDIRVVPVHSARSGHTREQRMI